MEKVTYSGCQKNVPLGGRFILQPLIPTFSLSEHIFEKRYKLKKIALSGVKPTGELPSGHYGGYDTAGVEAGRRIPGPCF